MSPSRPPPSSPRSPKRQKANPNHEPPPSLDTLSDSLTYPSIRAQVDELLSPTPRPSDEHIRALKAQLDNIPKKAKVIEVDSAYLRNTLRKTASGTTLSALFQSPNYESLSIRCTPPKSVQVVGSYLLGFGKTVDVAVEIPDSVFNDKDYLNYSYHDKRLLYLIYLSRNLLSTNLYHVSILNNPIGYPPKQTLTLSPIESPSTILRILPYTTIFPILKLTPTRRNIRPSGITSLPSDTTLATPSYNASIMIDSTMVKTLTCLHKTISTTPAFSETVKLLHAWGRRHHLPTFPLTSLLHDLLSSGLPHRAPREQLLRAALAALRNGKLATLKICDVPMASTLPKGLLIRFSDYAATALRLIEGQCAVDDPWYGIMPYLFTTARGKGVAKKPLSTLFDGFINLKHPRGEDILNRALVETGRILSIEPISSGFFGIRVTSYETACRRIDSRPDNVSVEKFQDFWGDIATLRRFRDGRVVESILWHGGVHAIREVVEHAVRRHLGDTRVFVVMGQLEDAAGVATVDPAAARAVPVFDELATVLRGLEGLPLSIRAVHATTPYLRRCGAFAIRPSESTRFVQPLAIVASFESSSAWPDNPVALSAAKAGFYLALKTKLAGEGIMSKATISFIDITFAGLVFRLRIRVDREKQFMQNQDDLKLLVWMTETLVRHHENIRSMRSPIMGRVSRMVKKWLNAHLLLSQMGPRGEELVEVIVANMFSRLDTPIPKSPFRGFCQVLYLLAEFPWEVCPLVVFLNSDDDSDKDLDKEDKLEAERLEFITSAQKKFSSKPGNFAVYCDRDDNGEAVTWFDKPYAPEAVIVARIRETAKASLTFIEEFAKEPVGSIETIFQPPTNGFDMVIYLEKQNLPYHPESINGLLRTKRRTNEMLLAGFDPVKRLVEELIARLGKYAMFLTCLNGGNEVFVVLRPIARSRVPFSLKETPYRTPYEENNCIKLLLSNDEFVGEIERICGQLVNNVEVIDAQAKSTG